MSLTKTLITQTPKTLEELQEYVGGYIQIIPISQNRQLICDEEGLLKDYQINTYASRLAGCPIVGCAVVLFGRAVLK